MRRVLKAIDNLVNDVIALILAGAVAFGMVLFFYMLIKWATQ